MRRQIRWSDNLRTVDRIPRLFYESRASEFLTQRGVLYVAGRFYYFDAGSNQAGKRPRVMHRKFTAEFLGLKTPDPKERPGESDSGLDAERAGKPSVNGEHR